MSVDVAVIVVNWNTRDLLAQCLRSVFSSIHDIDFEVVVLDNASTDGSADMVRTLFPQVKLIANAQNQGFAGGNNLALKHAGGRFLLLLNPDTIVQENSVNRLCEALRACSALGAVGAQLLNPDGSHQRSWEYFPSLQTELPVVNRLASTDPQPLDCVLAGERLPLLAVDWVSGACLMIRRETLEQVGVLDEDYWLYTEETDWCYRAHVAGWQIALMPEAQVVHLARAASRQRFVETMLHFYRSRLLFLSKHRGRVQACLVQATLCLKAVAWMAAPAISPLSQAFPDLPPSAVRAAYRSLLKYLLQPLDRLLARTW